MASIGMSISVCLKTYIWQISMEIFTNICSCKCTYLVFSSCQVKHQHRSLLSVSYLVTFKIIVFVLLKLIILLESISYKNMDVGFEGNRHKAE